MQKAAIILFSLLVSFSLFAQQYEGPIAPIEEGFGAWGDFDTAIDSFPNPSSSQLVTIVYPKDASAPLPTIFYSPGYGIVDYTRHLVLFKFIASKGYALVFSPYPSSIFHNSNNNKMLDGFLEAATLYPDLIDTSRVGLMGHSYGAGATPWVGKELFVERNWGENGRFMFLNATWFIRQMEQDDLESFPDDCKFICQVNDYDKSNDHRMSIDLFCNINIPNSEKDFIIVERDSVAVSADSTYIYTAGHNVVGTSGINNETRFDAHDYYAVFRLVEALAAYTFDGDLVAKNIALGNGSPEQVDMGDELKPLFVTDAPTPRHPESFYDAWPCHTNFFGINPRIDHCDDSCPPIVDTTTPIQVQTYTLYPNPSQGLITLEYGQSVAQSITIYNAQGAAMAQYDLSASTSLLAIDISDWYNGLYWLKLDATDIAPILFVKQ